MLSVQSASTPWRRLNAKLDICDNYIMRYTQANILSKNYIICAHHFVPTCIADLF